MLTLMLIILILILIFNSEHRKIAVGNIYSKRFFCTFSKSLSVGRWKEEMGNEIFYSYVDSFQ